MDNTIFLTNFQTHFLTKYRDCVTLCSNRSLILQLHVLWTNRYVSLEVSSKSIFYIFKKCWLHVLEKVIKYTQDIELMEEYLQGCSRQSLLSINSAIMNTRKIENTIYSIQRFLFHQRQTAALNRRSKKKVLYFVYDI